MRWIDSNPLPAQPMLSSIIVVIECRTWPNDGRTHLPRQIHESGGTEVVAGDISGVAFISKMMDRVGVFVQEDIPVASYSCSKTVAPFSFVFPPGTDTNDFPAVKVDGKETMCRLTADVVDDRGMTR